MPLMAYQGAVRRGLSVVKGRDHAYDCPEHGARDGVASFADFFRHCRRDSVSTIVIPGHMLGSIVLCTAPSKPVLKSANRLSFDYMSFH